jgi:hypothetical protein
MNEIFCSPLYAKSFVKYSSPAPLVGISLSGNLLCGIDSKDKIYCASNFEHLRTSLNWKVIAGGLMQISVKGKRLCGINRGNQLWCLNNIENGKYTIVAGLHRYVSINAYGALISVSMSNGVYFSYQPIFIDQKGDLPIPINNRNRETSKYPRLRATYLLMGPSIERRGNGFSRPTKEHHPNHYFIEGKNRNEQGTMLKLSFTDRKDDSIQLWGPPCNPRDQFSTQEFRMKHQFNCSGDAIHIGKIHALQYCIHELCVNEQKAEKIKRRLAQLLTKPKIIVGEAAKNVVSPKCADCCHPCDEGASK